MTQFFTVKQIDNSRLVRPAAPGRLRECCRRVVLGALVAAGGLLYAWQHFQCIRLGYQLEELKAERGRAVELNHQFKLEAASLRSPMRIDAIARWQLGLTAPIAAQVVPIEGPGDAVLAQARVSPHPPTQ